MHPLLNLANLIGVPAGREIAPEAVVVMSTLWKFPVGLVCDRFRGIIPAGQPSWSLSDALFTTADRALPRTRLWAGQPVLDLAPEQLFSAPQRAQFDQAMKESKENVDQLWELSELEAKLSVTPSAQGYKELAARYRELDWLEEAERVEARAAEVGTSAPVVRNAGGGLSGPFNRRVLLELLQVLHLTAKSGELLLDVPGGITGTISFNQGMLVDARCAGSDEGINALRQLCLIEAGRYQFFAGAPAQIGTSKLPATGTVIAELEQQMIGKP
jgi:hypothetical protein